MDEVAREKRDAHDLEIPEQTLERLSGLGSRVLIMLSLGLFL